MPEVDRSVSGPTQPVPPANGPVPADKQVPSKPDSNGRDSRIDQLTREKYEYKAQADQAIAQLRAQEARIAALEQVKGAEEIRSREAKPQSIQDLGDDALRQMVADRELNPEAVSIALGELDRRSMAKATESASRQAQHMIELEREKRSVERSVERRFGEAAWDPNNELYQRADQIYGKMLAEAERKFGRGQGEKILSTMPSIQERCFELADREIRAKDLDELPLLRRELEQRKLQDGLLAGASRHVERSEAVKAAIARKDRKGVFANLDIVKSLERG